MALKIKVPYVPSVFIGRGPLSRDEPIPGCPALLKEKRSLPGAPANFSGFLCVTALGALRRSYPPLRVLGSEPDSLSIGRGQWRPSPPPFWTAFAHPLRPTDPCSTPVHMEPFSYSAFKALVWIFATTTKICTRGGSTHALGFHATHSCSKLAGGAPPLFFKTGWVGGRPHRGPRAPFTRAWSPPWWRGVVGQGLRTVRPSQRTCRETQSAFEVSMINVSCNSH